ncbi:uncharacterized protein GLRG_07585 [Colletotrichum graminicola M1.001]|uniref:Uncharacterized protein n=1 Tax=Colletotrichum graminicola (strain M1.001 / M2 / FGSC 10212) TaxID=645133 RepID=E3QNY3_COLGM|nr:uncharacterized protein GLRG_07585 [Colletotrichum graminicola M1.001]EFQ32571.1 hypothetical protein GLRG_07585 [Colletotrichum graminicola M1.001]
MVIAQDWPSKETKAEKIWRWSCRASKGELRKRRATAAHHVPGRTLDRDRSLLSTRRISSSAHSSAAFSAFSSMPLPRLGTEAE